MRRLFNQRPRMPVWVDAALWTASFCGIIFVGLLLLS